ncbi:MAG TPA: hypothetical protein VLK33_20635, partial [Terriglobales bacterium]|nr:hypothetical protein [Terriglobales bacterium]
PPFSAKKIQGVPAYKLARKKQEVLLKPSQVEVKEFQILNVEGDRATFSAHVSSGTYIRCLAHDMGLKVGCGAHLELLRRTSCGEFTLAEAHTLEEVDATTKSDEIEKVFLHPRKLLPEMPSVTVTDEIASYIHSGRTVNLPEFSSARLVKVFLGQQELICIATRIAGTLFHPKIVFSATPALHTTTHS